MSVTRPRKQLGHLVEITRKPSGFSWIKGARAETYFYNLRHLSHHVGQLTAFLWKHGCEVSWVTGSRSKKRAKKEARRA